MISAVIGQCLVAACVVMTGLFGAKWHVGFPMWNRVVWGLRASYFPLANRIVLSFTWCSSRLHLSVLWVLPLTSPAQAWFGGQVMKTLLGSMFPSIYRMSRSDRTVKSQHTELTSRDAQCLSRIDSHGFRRFSMFLPLPLGFPTPHLHPARILSKTILIHSRDLDYHFVFYLLLGSSCCQGRRAIYQRECRGYYWCRAGQGGLSWYGFSLHLFSLLGADNSLGDLLWNQFTNGSDRRWGKPLYDGDGMD